MGGHPSSEGARPGKEDFVGQHPGNEGVGPREEGCAGQCPSSEGVGPREEGSLGSTLDQPRRLSGLQGRAPSVYLMFCPRSQRKAWPGQGEPEARQGLGLAAAGKQASGPLHPVWPRATRTSNILASRVIFLQNCYTTNHPETDFILGMKILSSA